MSGCLDARAWAERNFSEAQLGDPRRTRRLVSSAARIALQPEKSFTQCFDWNELRAFYRLCNQKEATLRTVSEPHWAQTRRAMAERDLVLIVHDTTQLDFTSHAALKGAGPIGEGTTRGFLQHNSLAIAPGSKEVLGLAYQQLRVREPAPPGETSYQRRRRQGRESQMWPEGIGACGPAPAACTWVDVADRGADIYEAMVAARQLGHHFLFRLQQNRQVFLDEAQSQKAYLKDHARALPSQGHDTVEIQGRGGREARTAQVELAAGRVWVPASAEVPRRRSQPILEVWVVRIWEPDPPAGVEPLEWILLCSLPSAGIEQLRQRRDWYCCRWLIEVFHDIEKNGCREEERRFETAARMEACLALLSIVAVRVLQLRSALTARPQEPAEQVATELESTLIRRLLKHKGPVLTVREFVRGVAKLGGFLGRKGDGEPGVRALWRGYQRLQDMVSAAQLLLPKPETG
jgi:transposase-like protein/transposase Tn5 family protein